MLQDPAKHVIVQEAPAIRAALGEEFGMAPGTLVTGKMIAALRRLGFDKVFDTNFAADLTIMEEGTELLERVKEGGKLPMITSCSPGWIKFCEHFFPDLLDHLSTCKSPQQMFGALAKTYYAKIAGIDPKDIVVVSIMPCTAKKFECQRDEMAGSGFQDVDYVLTTRELGRMIKEAGIDFTGLPDEDYDAPMGEYTGAGTIFGATGGVMEAAIRTVYAVVTGKNLPDLNITPVRGLEGVKEAAARPWTVWVKCAWPWPTALPMPASSWTAFARARQTIISSKSCAARAAASQAAASPSRRPMKSESCAPRPCTAMTRACRKSGSPMKTCPSRSSMRHSLKSPWGTSPMSCCTRNIKSAAAACRIKPKRHCVKSKKTGS